MSNCYIHAETPSVGTCVSCGKFICINCNTELKGKNTCKKCVDEIFAENQIKLAKLEGDGKPHQPMVFMNAGGGSNSHINEPNTPETQSATATYTKSKVTAGLLAILLGGIGMHKIYLGNWIQGFVYFIFCWTYVPLVLGIIEGIRYLLLTDEEFARIYDQGYRP